MTDEPTGLIPERVAITEIGKNQEITISTIFMRDGFYAGTPYETMIFCKNDDGFYDNYQSRCSNEAEALLQHMDAIAYVIKHEVTM